MAKYTNLTSLFTAIADAIRAKKGTTGKIVADNFPEEIASIQNGAAQLSIGSPVSVKPRTNGTIVFAVDTINMVGFYIRPEADTSTEFAYIYIGSVFYMNPNTSDGYYYVTSADTGTIFAERFAKSNETIWIDSVGNSSITLNTNPEQFEFRTSAYYTIVPFYIPGGTLLSTY